MKIKKLCTIVTDASWCPRTKVGGWAVWIVCENIRHKAYAAFVDKCKTSGEAEIKAAINGIYLAHKKFEDVDRYHFVIDCREAIWHIKNKKSDWRIQMQKIVGNTSITAKHVKAHGSTSTKRTWVNNWCDKHSKQEMKKIRDKR